MRGRWCGLPWRIARVSRLGCKREPGGSRLISTTWLIDGAMSLQSERPERMDGSRFDELSRFMAERPSRRTVVKAMFGAIAGSMASVGAALGAPRCKRVNQACQTTADCCPGPNANGNVYCKQVKKS